MKILFCLVIAIALTGCSSSGYHEFVYVSTLGEVELPENYKAEMIDSLTASYHAGVMTKAQYDAAVAKENGRKP